MAQEQQSVAQQVSAARGDDTVVVVVGAGVAGVTLAQLLRRQGRHPILVERRDDDAHPGYMLALMPMVDRALDDLGVREDYRRRSQRFDRYGVHSHTGRLIRVDSMDRLLRSFGDYRGICRGELLACLAGASCPVSHGTTVTAIEPDVGEGGRTRVRLDERGAMRVVDADLVVVADGIGSRTRRLVVDEQAVQVVDTGWSGWVAWVPDDTDGGLGEEVWGNGFFIGLYPVLGSVGTFVGGPDRGLAGGPRAFVAEVRSRLREVGPRIDRVLTAVSEASDPYRWPLTDCRAPRWSVGRAVLLGDAAAGFLPTAGIGAGMAIESAWVLSSLLDGTGPADVPELLTRYEQQQRPRVEAAQTNSRQLARMMFHHSLPVAVARDLALRLVSVDVALRPIQRLLANQPDPRASRPRPPDGRTRSRSRG